MEIGIIGCGIVGSACKFGFEKLGHRVYVHDTKLNTSIDVIMSAKLVFITVPTPQNKNGSCDTSIVEEVVCNLHSRDFDGLICIKSTVTPGTTQKLIDKTGRKICFVPEFLRERCGITDFVENHKLLAVGCHWQDEFELVSACHGNYPKHTYKLTPTEAELLKYYHNAFNALRVVFANECYDIAVKLGTNYANIKKCLLLSSDLPDIYLDVNDNFRGYTSPCFNKDLPALCGLIKDLGLDKLKLFETIITENEKFEKKFFPNMRADYV